MYYPVARAKQVISLARVRPSECSHVARAKRMQLFDRSEVLATGNAMGLYCNIFVKDRCSKALLN